MKREQQAPSGTIKSVPGFKPEVDADVVFGGDWLYIDPDKSRARLNVKGIAKYVLSIFVHTISVRSTQKVKIGRRMAYPSPSPTVGS